MLQILTVCGAGLGSSFACQMSVDAVLKELGVEAKLDHTDISSVGGAKADIILSGKNFEKHPDTGSCCRRTDRTAWFSVTEKTNWYCCIRNNENYLRILSIIRRFKRYPGIISYFW